MRKGYITFLQILMLFSSSSSTMAQKDSIDAPNIFSKLISNNESSKEGQNSTQRVSNDSTAWDWPISTPGKHGLDSVKLAELTELIRAGERSPGSILF